MRWHRSEKSGLDPRGDFLILQKHDLRLGFVTAVTGALAGAAVSELVHAVGDWRHWLLVATTVSAFAVASATLVFLRHFTTLTRDTYKAMTGVADDIASTVAHQAHLIPRDAIYPEMAESIRNAQFQVAVITYFMYDWDNDHRTFLQHGQLQPDEAPHGRDQFYAAIYECIERRGVEYVRVWQVPTDRLSEAPEVICREAVHQKERNLIVAVAEAHPEMGRWIVAEQQTTASFVLVDKRTLFMNIDFYDPKARIWRSPYMLLIKDAAAEAFADLQSIVTRLSMRETTSLASETARAAEEAAR